MNCALKRLLYGALLMSTACSRPAPAGCPATPAELSAIAAVPPPAPARIDSTLELRLNIPAYRLDVSVSGERRTTYQVAVGTARYPTRPGTFFIQSITWNPWWIPPSSPWARDEKPTPPGPSNPMGKVKLNYSPSYYLHGTPDSLRLERPASHGCVRMRNQDAIALATQVHAFTQTAPDSAEFEALLSSWANTRTIPLPQIVRLDIVYELAEVRDSLVLLHRDIYGRGAGNEREVWTALARAQLPILFDSAAVARFAARGAGAVILLDSLRYLD